MPSLILRAATPVLMVLLIIVSIYALLRGHHEPGGGFVGGLIIASAFSLHVLAYDVPSTRRLLRVAPQTLMGLGLSTILLSGVIGLVAGGAFLQGLWATVPVPGLGDVAVGTPVMFDVGVYAAVMGMVLMIVLMTAEMNA
ncbi:MULTISPECIES: Na+/H+ antiporter subunit B [Sorangium]|uniref:Cation:proton antiporter n=1 Tax=Sorangium cellulosum TaxID=56 RepID=A0A4P2QMM7_SORCE|nr:MULTISPECIES: Na+/H+ antiporter subunit B [Sorangium]AUX31329.1 cation:proton antiporter [Sorangium cellulosum]WCQ90712.1 Na(+)/H(+) antiporter subunit B [Sorangium sp. Soce836]